jgi:hypothetical protein
VQKLLWWNTIGLLCFLFLMLLGALIQKYCYLYQCLEAFPPCFLLAILYFPVLHLDLWPIFSLFLCWVRGKGQSLCECPVFSIPFITKAVLFLMYIFSTLVSCKSMKLHLGTLLCSSSLCFWFLWHYHGNITVIFLKSGSVILLALFFSLKIVWAIQGFFYFHINFKSIFFWSCEDCHWYFDS